MLRKFTKPISNLRNSEISPVLADFHRFCCHKPRIPLPTSHYGRCGILQGLTLHFASVIRTERGRPDTSTVSGRPLIFSSRNEDYPVRFTQASAKHIRRATACQKLPPAVRRYRVYGKARRKYPEGSSRSWSDHNLRNPF